MKKNLLYALALATSLVACTDDYTDWAAPQQNDPEEAKSVSVSVSAASAIDYANVTAETVQIFSTSVTAEEGATATYKVNLSNEDGSKTATLVADTNGSVSAAELQETVVSFFGKAPTPRVMKAIVDAYVDINGQTIKVTSSPIEVNVTLVAPQISKEYYLIGAPSSWDVLNTSLKFNHSGKDVYDDPIFTIVFPVSDGETWFAVTDSISINQNLADGSWSQVFGCAEGNGNNGEEGLLKRRADIGDDGSFKIVVAGDAKFIKMTLNMMDYTYKFEKLNFGEWIYVPGNHQGWNPETAPALQSPNFDGIYKGFTYLNGNFKFTKERNWNAEYNFNDFATKDDIFFNNDGSNINISEEGFYQITADVASSTLKAVKTSWGIIGPAQAGGWDSDTDLAWNAEDESWTATVELAADEFKFRANDDWGINVGGAFDNLTQDGGNMKITEAGTYEVKLFLTRSASDKMYCTLTKK